MDHGFILDATYRIEGGRPVVHLFGASTDGASFLVRDTRARPSFFLETRDLEAAGPLLERARGAAFPRVFPGVWKTMRGEPASEIAVALPGDVPPLRARLRAAGIECHEADVPFVTRYLIDRGIRGAIAIEGEAVHGRQLARVYENPTLARDERMPALRVLSLDIETDWRARRVRSFALCGDATHGGRAAEVHAIPPQAGAACPETLECGADTAECHYHPDETALVRALIRRVRDLDPDILTGWNLIGFDLAVLARACERLGVPFFLGRADLACRVLPPSDTWMTGRASVPGRAALDGLDLVRAAFVRLDDYSLDTAARTILGEGKLLAGEKRRERLERMYRERFADFLRYNLTDARLVLEILEKLRLIDLAARRSLLTGLPIGRTAASIAAFDMLYLSALHERGIVAPSVAAEGVRPRDEDVPLEPAEPHPVGGTVLDSLPGIHDQVWLFDYRSLYPSLILTFNIDPLSHLEAGEEDREAVEAGVAVARRQPDEVLSAPNGARFTRGEAILPRIVERLLIARDEARHRNDAAASTAIKILMNSFYGVLATPRCRFHDTRVANAVTTLGGAVLLWTRDRLEALGHPVLYGDTDSVFALSHRLDSGAAERDGFEMAARLNAELAEWVRERYRVESRLVLAFQRHFVKFFIPSHRAAEEGSKKRYAGLVETPAGRELIVAGLESVRRDWTVLAKDFQRHLLRLVLEGEPLEEYVAGVAADLRAGRRDADLVYRKALRKPLEAYRKTSPPHVKAARRMGGRHGRVISYVMTVSGPQPLGYVDAPLDYAHYLEKQLRPIADAILVHVGTSLDRILKGEGQLGLF